jgi:hypothetical protein
LTLLQLFLGDKPWTVKRLLSPGLLLMFLPCILFYPVFSGACLLPANLLKDVYPWRTGNPRDLVPWNVLQFDGITQFYPWRLFAAETWRSGYVPLWNPHQFCGTPFLANGQSAVLYLPNLIFVLMQPKFAFGWSAILHLAFTGGCAYLFFRRAGGCSRWAATIGAACWQLSNWQISWIALPTFLDTSAWLPLGMFFLYALSKKPTLPRATLVAAVGAAMILAGHLQISFYCVLILAAFGIYLSLKERLPVLKIVVATVAAVGICLFLISAQLIPTLELSRQSTRGGAKALPSAYRMYVRLAMPAEQITGLFAPGFFGHPDQSTYWEKTPYPENAGYIGTLGLLLAFIAIIRKKISSDRIFFVAAAASALLVAVGTPLNMPLYYGIPGFSSTGSPARILVLWTFCVSFLAAQGADDVLERTKTAWAGVAAYATLAAVTIGLTLARFMHRDSTYLQFASNDLRLFAGLLLASVAIVYLLSRNTLKVSAAGPLMFALVALDLLFVAYSLNSVARSADVYPVTPSIAYLQQHAYNDRIMPLNTDWSNTEAPNAVLPPNGATVFGFYDTQGYDSLQTKSYKKYANEMDGNVDSSPSANGNITFTNAAGSADARAVDAKYLLSLTPLSGFGNPVVTDGPVKVYVDPKAKGNLAAAQFREQSATRVVISSTGISDITFQAYPGWKIGRPGWPVPGVPIHLEAPTTSSAAWAITHIEVTPNKPIELRYQPESFQIGLYFSLVGLSILFLNIGHRLAESRRVVA